MLAALRREQRVVATPFGDVTLGMYTALDADTTAFFMAEAATQRVDWLADWPKPEDEFDEEEQEA